MQQHAKHVPGLLVSIRCAAELDAALEGGADWIDLKEPNLGALAAVESQTAVEVDEALAGRTLLSAALGELRDWDQSSACELLDVPGISVVKLGLAGCGQMPGWQQRWQQVTQLVVEHRKQLAAVVYADWRRAQAPPPAEIIALAVENNCRYLLIDTFEKDGCSTFDFLPLVELEKLLIEARKQAMTTVLAGSLNSNLLGQIPTRQVDVVAVRGAVCCGKRNAPVDVGLVRNFRTRLRSQLSPAGEPTCPASSPC